MKKNFMCLAVAALVLFSGCGVINNTEPEERTPENYPERIPDLSEEEISTDEYAWLDNTDLTGSALSAEEIREMMKDVYKDQINTLNDSFTDGDFDYICHLYENGMGGSEYFMAVTNNSDSAVQLSSTASAKDESGNVLGNAELSIEIIGPGETTVGCFIFDNVTGIKSVDCEMSYDKDPSYKPVVGNLTVDRHENATSVSAVISNDGDTVAQFVEAYALFFDDEENLLYYDHTTVGGSSIILPGKKITVQLNNYSDYLEQTYDRIEFYLTGRSDGSDGSAYTKDNVSGDSFDVRDIVYKWDNYGAPICEYYLEITNNSNDVVAVTGNATAYDSKGNIVGANDLRVEDVVSPGDKALGMFYITGSDDISKVEYDLTYEKRPGYIPVNGLSIVQTPASDGLEITVTNNGEETAEFLRARVLFFDKDNNIVASGVLNFADDLVNLSPGSRVIGKADCETDFDHAEVYPSSHCFKPD